METEILFDITTIPFTIFSYSFWILPTMICVVTLASIFRPVRDALQQIMRPRILPVRPFLWFVLVFSLFMTYRFYRHQYDEWKSLRDLYLQNQCQTVEGPVTKLAFDDKEAGRKSYDMHFTIDRTDLIVHSDKYFAPRREQIRSRILVGDILEVHYCGDERRIAKIIRH